jgi:hypothetical protein
MSDRIIESFNEMKQIYLGSISGNYIQEGNEYLNYITEGKKEGPGEEYEDKYEKTGKKSKDYDGDGEIRVIHTKKMKKKTKTKRKILNLISQRNPKKKKN